MRQILFLLASAMFVAFSLSWAAPNYSPERLFAVPDRLIFHHADLRSEKFEISATLTLKDSCERVEDIEQEFRGNKIIFAIRIQQSNDHLCHLQIRPDVSVTTIVESRKLDFSMEIDIYFRIDEENLKYFGAVDTEKELFSKN